MAGRTLGSDTEVSRSTWARLALLSEQKDSEYSDLLDQVVRHYQSLVAATAFRFKSTLPSYVTSDDLLSYGQIGLLRAIERYDPDLGPFRRFASSYVYGAILDELRSQDWAPRGLRREQRLVRQATAQLGTTAAAPSLAAVAAQLGWDAARLTSTIRQVTNSHHQTLEGAEHEEGVLRESEDLDGILSSDSLCEMFTDTFETFDEPTQYVLARVYFLAETLTTVAQTTGLPLVAVRRLHLDALGVLFDRAQQVATAY